jgi:hypothetical protein
MVFSAWSFLVMLSLAHVVTLFAASFNLVSAHIGALLLVTTTQSSAYPRIVHVSLIALTISLAVCSGVPFGDRFFERYIGLL